MKPRRTKSHTHTEKYKQAHSHTYAQVYPGQWTCRALHDSTLKMGNTKLQRARKRGECWSEHETSFQSRMLGRSRGRSRVQNQLQGQTAAEATQGTAVLPAWLPGAINAANACYQTSAPHCTVPRLQRRRLRLRLGCVTGTNCCRSGRIRNGGKRTNRTHLPHRGVA